MSQTFTWPSQSVTATNPSVGINGNTAPIQSTQVAGQDSSGDLIPLLVDAIGELQVNVTDSVLPTGAATEATLLQVDTDIQAGNALLTTIDADTSAMVLSLASIDTKLTAPLSVVGPLTDAELRASAVPVSVASLPLPAGAATEAKQDVGNASLASIDSKLSSPMPVTGPLTDAELRATPVPVSGPLTDTELRATPVPVSGPLTDAELRATPVPVSMASAPAQSGRSVVTTVRNDYSGTPVTTGAWVELVSSLSSAVNMVEIFDSSGQTLELGIGGVGLESRLILVFPGGNGQVPVSIGASSRLSIRAVSATANAGEIDLNLYS